VGTIRDIGKISYVFNARERTTLMVVTGIMGPPDGANRPQTLIAFYYLQDPDRSHESRLLLLRDSAETALADWGRAN
jgi:hypothetical protein